MDPVFKSRLPIVEAQIIQRSLDHVLVRLVPAKGYSTSDADAIVERIRDRLGDVTVEIEEMDAIPRTANGKLRAVVCALDEADRSRVGAVRGAVA